MKIVKKSRSFFFQGSGHIGDKELYDTLEGKECDIKGCYKELSTYYSFILKKLEKNDLLPTNYKRMCCSCWAKQNEN